MGTQFLQKVQSIAHLTTSFIGEVKVAAITGQTFQSPTFVVESASDDITVEESHAVLWDPFNQTHVMTTTQKARPFIKGRDNLAFC